MANKRQLTGLIRYRLEDDKLILQVQERVLVTFYHFSVETEWHKYWRDATLADITVQNFDPTKLCN